jgi:molybdate transport system ATP-binding protein
MIDASIHFDRGEFALDLACKTDSRVTGVFGPSGAGKSTLINLIAGLERPDRGSIKVQDQTMFDSQRRIDIPAHRRRIGVVFQEHRLFPHLSVRGNLLYGRPRRANDGEVTRVIDLLELGPLLRRRVAAISGGERQRVALGRALISQPKLLLLDEPLASLDLRLKQQIIPYLQRIRDESAIPILYVSHDIGEILQLTDHLLVLDRGTLVGYGRYSDLVHQDATLHVIHSRGMRNILSGRVIRHETADGLSVIQIGDAASLRQLSVPLTDASVGAPVTLAIQPWDIALAHSEMKAISIQNQVSGTVTRCSLHEHSAIVEVDIGLPLIVEVSRRSVASLEIESGREVVCLVKSHAIRAVPSIA